MIAERLLKANSITQLVKHNDREKYSVISSCSKKTRANPRVLPSHPFGHYSSIHTH